MFPAFSLSLLKTHTHTTIATFWCTNEFEHGRKESWRKVKVKLKREPDGFNKEVGNIATKYIDKSCLLPYLFWIPANHPGPHSCPDL